MEFGRLTLDQLEKVDFTLPPDPIRNSAVLKGGSTRGKVYVGMTQWGRTEWVGKIYPQGAKQKDFLSHYVRHFTTVELNATHYNLFSSNDIQKWAEIAGDKPFRFCPKMYKGITHSGPLNKKKELLKQFDETIQGFADHLGPIFIQLNENYSIDRKRELFEFIEDLPTSTQFFLELRGIQYLANEALFDYLGGKKIGVVITDTAGRRDIIHMKLTVPIGFVRFVSNDLHPTDFIRVNEWASRLKYWLDSGMKEFYFFVHMNDESKSIELAKYVIQQFNDVAGANLTPITYPS